MVGTQPSAKELRALSCYERSPESNKVDTRVRCNRPNGHDGPHQKIRAKDFKVLAEWTDLTYSILPGGKVVAS